MSGDKLRGFLAFAVGEVFTLGTVGQAGQSVGGEIAGWLSAVVAAQVLVKALFLRLKALATEVPLAEMQGGPQKVRAFGHGAQVLGEGNLLERQLLGPGGRAESNM